MRPFVLYASGVTALAAVAAFATLLVVSRGARAAQPEREAPASERPWPAERRVTPDDQLWWGVEYGQRWDDVAPLPLDVRGASPDRAFVRAVLRASDAISPALRQILARHGGRLVLHAENVTEQPECRDLKGRRCGLRHVDDMTYDEAVGLYSPRTKTAYVQTDRHLSRVRHTLLHELGHMLDDALGDPSGDADFDAALTSDDDRTDLGYPERIDFRDRKQSEYFAESFADYHVSADSRRWMRRACPAAARYWDGFVATHNARRARTVTILVDAALDDRLRRRAAGPFRPRHRRHAAD